MMKVTGVDPQCQEFVLQLKDGNTKDTYSVDINPHDGEYAMEVDRSGHLSEAELVAVLEIVRKMNKTWFGIKPKAGRPKKIIG